MTFAPLAAALPAAPILTVGPVHTASWWAALVLAVPLLVFAGSVRLARAGWRGSRPTGDGPHDEVRVTTAPEWAVEAFGHDVAFEMASVAHDVVTEVRDDLSARLDEQSRFLSQVPVSATWSIQDGYEVRELVLQFADGSEVRLAGIDPVCAMDARAVQGATAASVRLGGITLDGPQARVEVNVGERCHVVLARQVQLDVPSRSDGQRRRLLRRLRRRS